ncbi:MAG: polyprenyl synthetase family protein [Magnetospiraceae bacterium]
MLDLKTALAEAASSVEQELEFLLPTTDTLEAQVVDAMRYATLNGGKRLRPFLVMECAKLFNVARESALRTAAALEMVHCYSLVHDDLPAMDDDDLRRGLPTCHKKFDEATAILAGDGLLTLAFEILADEKTHSDPKVCCELVAALASAAGHQGMVGGQMIDLQAETNPLDMLGITRLQRMKTGALFSFACVSGAILGRAPEAARHALANYAHEFGLAFQIADDLLDEEGTVSDTGKAVGKDAAAGKASFVRLLGAAQAREQARRLADQAAKHLDYFGEKSDLLKDLAYFAVERRG